MHVSYGPQGKIIEAKRPRVKLTDDIIKRSGGLCSKHGGRRWLVGDDVARQLMTGVGLSAWWLLKLSATSHLDFLVSVIGMRPVVKQHEEWIIRGGSVGVGVACWWWRG